jgi:hypothetical protein
LPPRDALCRRLQGGMQSSAQGSRFVMAVQNRTALAQRVYDSCQLRLPFTPRLHFQGSIVLR